MGDEPTPAKLVSKLAEQGGLGLGPDNIMTPAFLDLMRLQNEVSEQFKVKGFTETLTVSGGALYPDADNPIGRKYTVELWLSGQQLSVVIDRSGKVIQRSYTDRGDIHADKVMKTLRGWIKSIEQAQRGARPKGMSEATQRRYDLLWQSWRLAKGMTEDQFCKKANINRRTLDRIIAYESKKR